MSELKACPICGSNGQGNSCASCYDAGSNDGAKERAALVAAGDALAVELGVLSEFRIHDKLRIWRALAHPEAEKGGMMDSNVDPTDSLTYEDLHDEHDCREAVARELDTRADEIDALGWTKTPSLPVIAAGLRDRAARIRREGLK